MSKRKDFIWIAIQLICWLIFIGYIIQTGALIFNYIFSLFKPIAAHNLHLGLDLSELYSESMGIYTLVSAVIIAISALKGFVFYIVIKLFRTLNLVKPFSEQVSIIISKVTYYAFAIGIISLLAQQLVKGISDKGYDVGVVARYWNDGGAFLMMSAILFVIALIFQNGIDLQNENDLTI